MSETGLPVLRRPFTVILVAVLVHLFAGGQQYRLFLPAFPGTEPDSVLAGRYCDEAARMLSAGLTGEAFDLAGEALQYAMRSGQEEYELKALDLLAEIARLEGNAGDAVPYALRAVSILENRDDTLRLRALYDRIAGYYSEEGVTEMAFEYYRRSLRLTPQPGLPERAAYLEKMGLAASGMQQPDSAAVYFTQLVQVLELLGEDNTYALHLQARNLTRAKRYRESLDVYRQLFGRAERSGNKQAMYAVKNNMAYNHTMLKDHGAAAAAFLEAIGYGEEVLTPGELALLKTNTAVSCQNNNNREEALKYFRQAIGHLQQSGNQAEKSRVENMTALVYYHDGDLYNAGMFSRDAITSAANAGDPARIAEASLTYSRVLREGNDPIQALSYYERYLAIRDSIQLEQRLRDQELASRKLSLERSERELRLRLKEEKVNELAIRQLSLQLEKEEQEKELLKREKDLEQLEKERLQQSLEIARQRHESEQQERQNRILEQENRIKDMRLDQERQKQVEQEQEIAMLEQEQRMNLLELEREKATRKAMITTIVLVGLIALSILGSLITTRRKNQLLAAQKKEIEEKNTDLEMKNEEIVAQRDEIEAQRDLLSDQKSQIEQINSDLTESIEYARRIQSSTLHPMDELSEIFAGHFILFRPRDIVSGDFYWMARVENTAVIAVVDCTGHGVPGAIMSMLGMSLLKEIVVKEYITHPGVILRRLRKEVINALGQKGRSGEQRDGMDLSLITFDPETRKLEFSGAYNSLYLVRNKKHPPPVEQNFKSLETDGKPMVLYEVPGDKMPIALFDRMDKFTTREVDLMEGDRIYLFTDGYADQFGGPLGKKFMYRPFKQLLLQITGEPMAKQLEILTQTLDDWKSGTPQVDDICVMGIEVGKKDITLPV